MTHYALAGTAYDVVGLGWTVPPAAAREVGGRRYRAASARGRRASAHDPAGAFADAVHGLSGEVITTTEH